MAQHRDAKLPKKRFGQRTYRNPRRGLARAGAFQNVSGIRKIVLQAAGQIGVSGTRPGYGLVLLRLVVGTLHGQHLRPIFPVLVLNDDRDRRTDGFRIPHAGDNFGAVRFNLHTPATAIPLLAAP